MSATGRIRRGEPEIIWKQGAENDLLQIFADLEERREGAGARLVGKLDFTLGHLRAHPALTQLRLTNGPRRAFIRHLSCRLVTP